MPFGLPIVEQIHDGTNEGGYSYGFMATGRETGRIRSFGTKRFVTLS
jgi:hypothetical protein